MFFYFYCLTFGYSMSQSIINRSATCFCPARIGICISDHGPVEENGLRKTETYFKRYYYPIIILRYLL